MNTRIIAVAIAATAAVVTYDIGVRTGHDQATHSSVAVALQTNARELHTARAHQDTTKHAAVTQTGRVDAERVHTRAIEQSVTVVDSATVEVTTIDSIYRAGVPPLVVTEINQDRLQIHDDSIAINLWIANDSAQMDIITRLDERTQLLEGDVKTESRAAFWRGAKIGAIAAALVALALHFAP